MIGILTYSGIATKVRAMERSFVSTDDFYHLAEAEDVLAAVEYLSQNPDYKDIFADANPDTLHRGMIEQNLTRSLYQSFTRLYRFATLKQRRFLDLYFMHYEITIIKKCLRSALEHRPVEFDLSVFRSFFERHSKLDLIKLSASSDISEFITNMEGSIFYPLLDKLRDSGHATLFDYEMQMDLMYFKTQWNMKKKYLTKSEQKIISQCFGTRLDILNIQWIYRSIKYYHLSPEDIAALLIPISFRLRQEDVYRLIHAEDLDSFFQILSQTHYNTSTNQDLSQHPDLEVLYQDYVNRIHALTAKTHPYSIAALNSYLHFKELEIQKIITIIECVRYKITPDVAISYITGQKGGIRS